MLRQSQPGCETRQLHKACSLNAASSYCCCASHNPDVKLDKLNKTTDMLSGSSARQTRLSSSSAR
jgi:hypothetical protein